MPIKFNCQACGKRLGVQDEYAGRQSICPVCGAEIEVPSHTARKAGTSRPMSPPAVPPALTQIRTSEEEDDEPMLYRTPRQKPGVSAETDQWSSEAQFSRLPDEPTNEKKRPLWRDPIVVIGSAVPTLILVVFFGYLAWPHVRAYMSRNRARPRASAQDSGQVARAPNSGGAPTITAPPAAEGEPPRGRQTSPRGVRELAKNNGESQGGKSARAARGRPPLTNDEMLGHIKIYMDFRVGQMLEQEGVEGVRIQSLDLEPLPADERMIPFLYRVTASVAVKLKPKKPGNASTHGSAIWKILMQMMPDEDSPVECWMETMDSRTGKRFARKHYDLSEWKPEFRDKVAAAWVETFKEYERYLQEHNLSWAPETSKLAVMIPFKTQVADKFKITYDEFNEILEATD